MLGKVARTLVVQRSCRRALLPKPKVMSGLRRVAVLGSTLAALLVTAAPAQAGRVVATGHPFDLACASRVAPDPGDGCGALRTIVGWTRAGAPDGGKPLLLLQPNDGPLQAALSAAYSGGSPPSLQVVDPSASYAAQMPIDVSAYSTVVVASDRPDGARVDLPPAVRSKLRAFFDEGGGVVLLAGSPGGLLPVGALKADAGPRPYVRTDDGRELGLSTADTGCCTALQGFVEPSRKYALLVAERDGAGAPVTVFGSGVFAPGHGLTSPIALPLGADDDSPGTGDRSSPGTGDSSSDAGSSRCQSRRRFRMTVKQLPGLQYRRVSIKVGSRKAKIFTGRIRSVIDLRGLPKGRYTVRIAVTTRDGQTFTGARRYRTCAPKKRSGSKNRL